MMMMPTMGSGAVAAAVAPTGRPDPVHHRLYEFAKTALIKIFISPYATVCDLYCGAGADADKWDEAQIGHYIGIDEPASGIADAREAWESQTKPYTAEFCELDPCSENLEAHLQDKGMPADVVCCLQHLQAGGIFLWTKYQKNVEASHNKGNPLKPNVVPNCIRSENYVMTFEVEEEKFPLFGKKYQLKFPDDITCETHCLVHFASLIRLAGEAGLEYVEIQNLTEFYDDNRAQFAGMLHSFGPNFVDPRGRLLQRAFDVLGLYATFVFQKPATDVVPPIFTPILPDGNHMLEEEWSESWRQPGSSMDEDRNGHADNVHVEHHNLDKGILGPGPADLRFSEPL